MEIKYSFITLIPKKNEPETVGDFWPFVLCNMVYKILSKVMVNHIKPLLDKNIGPYKNGFVLGR